MEEEIMGLDSQETNLPSKPLRRKASSQGHSVINLKDATREKELTLKVKGNNSSNYEIYNVSMFSDAQYYCYPLFEAMPLPGPTWSTTAPCVLADNQPPPASDSELIDIEASAGGLEWGETENHTSSYTWWLGFLEGLDGNNMITEKVNQTFVENFVMENSKVLLSHEPSFVDAIDDWLIIPTTEKDLGDTVMP